MKRLIFIASCLGLLACTDANGRAASQKQVSKPDPNQAQIVTLPSTAAKSNTQWVIDKTKSTLSFTGSQSGAAFSGVFESFAAQISFDPANLKDAKVVVTIDMNSADAGDGERTDALPGKEWFYTRKFPVAKYSSTAFTHLNGDKYIAEGQLTIKDITHFQTLVFTLKIENGQAVMDGGLTVNRKDFKIGTGMWASEEWVAHDVEVNVHLVATHMDG